MAEDGPKDIKDCISREMFHATIRHLEDRITHLADDRKKADEEHSKELTYKTNMNRQLVIWLGVITFGILGIMWNDLAVLQQEFQAHSEELYHQGAGHFIEENTEKIGKIFCKLFDIC